MKPRVYRSRGCLRLAARVLGWLLLALLALAVALFFLLRSWTVYDEEGAHIRFPWNETASASAGAGGGAPWAI